MAVIGTRSPTARGVEQAREFARDAVKEGICVVSGLARGIDAAAHRGALDANGKTIAVLGTPIDRVYPAEHRGLAEQILSGNGVLVSEYGINDSVGRHSFVERDRIQSGLSVAVVAVQTGVTGGTMQTMKFAQVQGRLRYCLPPHLAELDAPQTAGVRHLLDKGEACTPPDCRESMLTNTLLRHRNGLLAPGASDDNSGQGMLPV